MGAMTCRTCGGSGHTKYEMRKVVPRNMNAARERKCRRCKGAGQEPLKVPPCPRCKSTDTEPLRNFGRAVPGRFQCISCRRWFGPNNPPDAGGTGLETAR